MQLQLSHFPHFTPLHPAHNLRPTVPPYSSCPWVILISSLASTFPTYFHLSFMLLILCTFLPSLPLPFPHLTPLHAAHPLPPKFPPYGSCPWVILISSLTSTFPTLFLPSPCLFSTCHLCYLFSVPFPPLSPSHSPIDNPPCGLHFYGSVPVLVVCLICFCFCFLGSIVDSCEFAVIFTVHIFYLLFLR